MDDIRESSLDLAACEAEICTARAGKMTSESRRAGASMRAADRGAEEELELASGRVGGQEADREAGLVGKGAMTESIPAP